MIVVYKARQNIIKFLLSRQVQLYELQQRLVDIWSLGLSLDLLIDNSDARNVNYYRLECAEDNSKGVLCAMYKAAYLRYWTTQVPASPIDST